MITDTFIMVVILCFAAPAEQQECYRFHSARLYQSHAACMNDRGASAAAVYQIAVEAGSPLLHLGVTCEMGPNV